MKKRKTKQTSLLIALIIVLSFSVVGTIAYLIDITSEKNNVFTPSEVTCTVHEPNWNDGAKIKENVSIQNNGDTDAYIRATIIVTWQNAAGEVLAQKPVAGTDYSLELNEDGSWDIDNTTDDYYYYTSVVPAIGDSASSEEQTYTTALIKTCEVKAEAPQDGYTLHVEVIASAIQSNPSTVVSENWGVTVDENNKISK